VAACRAAAADVAASLADVGTPGRIPSAV